MPETRPKLDRHDAIQSALIDQMNHLGMNPNQVAELVEGKISRGHVCDYLTRKSGMGTHKAQHLMKALGLTLVSK